MSVTRIDEPLRFSPTGELCGQKVLSHGKGWGIEICGGQRDDPYGYHELSQVEAKKKKKKKCKHKKQSFTGEVALRYTDVGQETRGLIFRCCKCGKEGTNRLPPLLRFE